jgi:DNA-binding NtrC family response regulator
MIAPTVLLVDDEASFVDVLARRLAMRGFEVVRATSGTEALDLLDNVPNIEVAVLDLNMPGMDGLTTLDRIKRLHPLVEVIILTGHGTVPSSVECLKAGAYNFLMKPTDTESLVEEIEAAASRNRQNQNLVVTILSSPTKSRSKLAENADRFVRRAVGLPDGKI